MESVKHYQYSTNCQWVPSVRLRFVGLSSDTSSVPSAAGAGAAAADAVGPVTMSVDPSVGPVTVAVEFLLPPYLLIASLAI